MYGCLYGSVVLPFPSQFGFHPLALSGQFLLCGESVVRGLRGMFSQLLSDQITPLLGCIHRCLPCFDVLVFVLLTLLQTVADDLQPGRFLHLPHLFVDGTDGGFLPLEITLWLLEIKDSGYEIRPVVAVGEQSGIGCEESHLPFIIFHHEHAEHLAL